MPQSLGLPERPERALVSRLQAYRRGRSMLQREHAVLLMCAKALVRHNSQLLSARR
jgi:hypothetical protein